ncbi:MAG: hypothetical protein V4735_00890 [Pseudomonadota bacterium]
MTQPVTVSPNNPDEAAAPDLAPVAGMPPLGQSTDTLALPVTQPLIQLEPVKRHQSWGEKVFNFGTYGGVAMLGNEVASFGITEAVKEGRVAHAPYKHFESLFSGLKRFTNSSGAARLPEYVIGTAAKAPRLPYLLVATLGGMFMVPFVKALEDRKGSIVRALDRSHHGDAKVDNDPQLLEAHREMDDAPKQSWGSLWKGRVTTVIFAALADFSFGWPDALTTKMFKNNATYQKYASLERAADTVAGKLVDVLKVAPEKRVGTHKLFANAGWLLTLSTTLTILFYASSKMFATRRDEKLERKQEHIAGHPPLRDDVPLLATAADGPQNRISQVNYEQAINAPQQIAAGV